MLAHMIEGKHKILETNLKSGEIINFITYFYILRFFYSFIAVSRNVTAIFCFYELDYLLITRPYLIGNAFFFGILELEWFCYQPCAILKVLFK